MKYILEGTPQEVVERYMALPQRAKESDFGEFDRNIVIVDTETTGFSLNHDELTQIAAARMEQGEIVDWFITFVNPGKSIPDDVAHLTNIHDEDVKDAPLPAEALARLVEFVGDAKVVAHNAEFDRNFTTKHPAGYPLLENTWLDSLDLSRIALPRMKSHRLIDLVKAFGAPLSTHRADDDVAATCALFRILLAAVESMPAPLVREIAGMATPAEWPTVKVFSYFASREEQEGIIEGSPSAEGASSTLPFSLRSLRRARVGKSEQRAKRDPMHMMPDGRVPAMSFPSKEAVEEAFSAAGVVGALYDDYEPRSEQLEMAQAVRRAFATSENLMVEAGTGVGKSMAYIVPAVLTARENNIAVGVATKTNALLDQLVYKELPGLEKALREQRANVSRETSSLGASTGTHGARNASNDARAANAADVARAARNDAVGSDVAPAFTFAALKGFSHYPCLRKIERIATEGPGKRTVANTEYSQAPALAALLSFVEQTEYDDMDSLKIDYRVLPRRSITTTSHDCMRRKCPFYGTSCFVHGARRRAESADVVVTNHSLLFCDLAADGGLLPPVRFWVVDEAHGAENEARRAFSLELSLDDMGSLAQRVSAEETSRNVFVRAERTVTLNDENAITLFFALTSKAKAAGREFAQAEAEFASHVRDLLFYDPSKRSKGYEYVDLWINDEIRAGSAFQALSGFGCTMSERAEKLVTASQELVGYLEDVEGAAVVQREIASVAMELKDIIRACDVILSSGSDAYVYAAHLCHKADRGGDKLEALLYNVGAELCDTLYANTRSVVFASATLTANNSFQSFQDAMGLNSDESSRAGSLSLASSYDFDRQMTVYVAKDMPEPSEPRYLSALQDLLVAAHRAQQGSMLTLFTNRKEMEKCFEVVQPELKTDNLRLVCQKWGVSVKGLRDDFLADEHLSLFALKSFWEGFDAPGATLKGVIIPKLPFAKPTDPLSCERSARDDQAWRRYVLPAAVLEIKQAAGRLIRKSTDEGVLILADKRLVTKGYGKAFLNSLPSKNIRVCTVADIVRDIERNAGRDFESGSACGSARDLACDPEHGAQNAHREG
ncbi:MAG: helicase C-terminal domain-containing protein [Eggerthellaceae bacterium]|nr:helicase C-terminal domain-containing protein [Eggerthellaceae bacterium]